MIDTDVISALRQPERASGLADWVRSEPETELFASVVTLGEIERGIQLQIPRNREFAVILQACLDKMTFFADRILDFGAKEARIWGRLSAEIGHNGVGLMIAATAIRYGATAVHAIWPISLRRAFPSRTRFE